MSKIIMKEQDFNPSQLNRVLASFQFVDRLPIVNGNIRLELLDDQTIIVQFIDCIKEKTILKHIDKNGKILNTIEIKGFILLKVVQHSKLVIVAAQKDVPVMIIVWDIEQDTAQLLYEQNYPIEIQAKRKYVSLRKVFHFQQTNKLCLVFNKNEQCILKVFDIDLLLCNINEPELVYQLAVASSTSIFQLNCISAIGFFSQDLSTPFLFVFHQFNFNSLQQVKHKIQYMFNPLQLKWLHLFFRDAYQIRDSVFFIQIETKINRDLYAQFSRAVGCEKYASLQYKQENMEWILDYYDVIEAQKLEYFRNLIFDSKTGCLTHWQINPGFPHRIQFLAHPRSLSTLMLNQGPLDNKYVKKYNNLSYYKAKVLNFWSMPVLFITIDDAYLKNISAFSNSPFNPWIAILIKIQQSKRFINYSPFGCQHQIEVPKTEQLYQIKILQAPFWCSVKMLFTFLLLECLHSCDEDLLMKVAELLDDKKII